MSDEAAETAAWRAERYEWLLNNDDSALWQLERERIDLEQRLRAAETKAGELPGLRQRLREGDEGWRVTRVALREAEEERKTVGLLYRNAIAAADELRERAEKAEALAETRQRGWRTERRCFESEVEQTKRLRAENERLRAALEQIAGLHQGAITKTCATIARQALGEEA